MDKHAPYENEHVEGLDKLANLEVCADMEAILQPTQAQQVEAACNRLKYNKLLRNW